MVGGHEFFLRDVIPEMAHRDIWLHRKNRSQSGYGRHGRTCCRLDPIAIDPKRTLALVAAWHFDTILSPIFDRFHLLVLSG